MHNMANVLCRNMGTVAEVLQSCNIHVLIILG